MARLLNALLLVSVLAASSVQSLSMQHGTRELHRHAAIAARHAAALMPVSEREVTLPKRRRARKRCISRDSSATSSTNSIQGVANVAPVPNVIQSSSSPSPTQDEQQQQPTQAPETTQQPTTQQQQQQPTTQQAPATTQAPSSGSGGNSLSGDGTFYNTGLTACGITNADTDFIAAVSAQLFDTYPGYDGVNPNNNPICGKVITAHFQGKEVTVTITDRCVGCAFGDLDFTPSAFNVLADFALGRINPITWNYPA